MEREGPHLSGLILDGAIPHFKYLFSDLYNASMSTLCCVADCFNLASSSWKLRLARLFAERARQKDYLLPLLDGKILFTAESDRVC